MSNIAEFRNAIRSGVLRQNKWRVLVDFPFTVGTTDDTRQASLLARTANVPPSNLGVIDLIWGGRAIPLPGDRTYEEFTVNFINVNDHNVRNAFERWSEAMNGSETNTGLTNFDDFMRDITLDLQDMNENIVKSYVLKDAWPSIVGTSDMDAGSQDTFAEFSVTFRYVNLASDTTR